MRFPFPRLLVFCLTLVALLSVAPLAGAQSTATLTINTPVQRKSGAGAKIDNPTILNQPYALNLAGCKDNQSFDLPVQFLNPTSVSVTIQGWASQGVDCSIDTNRVTTNSLCWPVTTTYSPPTATTGFNVNVRVQDLISQFSKSPKVATYQAADATACTATSDGTISFYLLALQGTVLVATGVPVAGSPTVEFPLHVLGPAAPALTMVQGGNEALVLTFTPPGGSTTATATDDSGAAAGTTNNIQSYVAYCSPQGAAATVLAPTVPDANPSICTPDKNVFNKPPPDASTASTSGALTPADDAAVAADADAAETAADAGTTTGTTTTADAGTTTSGATSNTDPGWICSGYGSLTAGASKSARLEGFKNGYAYNVAIAATDSFGNTGPRSDILCGVPQPIDSFWDAYKGNGGAAGGGYCSVEGVGMPFGAGATVLIVVGAAIGLVRRRKVS